MKKKIIFTSLMALVITISSFALPNNLTNEKALASFDKQFKQATNVSWTKAGEKEKVCFTLNDRVICAYYSTEGNLLSISRNILSTELPLSLSINLKQHYNDYWINSLTETAGEDGTTYYVMLENATQEVILKSTNISDWSVFQKFKKY